MCLLFGFASVSCILISKKSSLEDFFKTREVKGSKLRKALLGLSRYGRSIVRWQAEWDLLKRLTRICLKGRLKLLNLSSS